MIYTLFYGEVKFTLLVGFFDKTKTQKAIIWKLRKKPSLVNEGMSSSKSSFLNIEVRAFRSLSSRWFLCSLIFFTLRSNFKFSILLAGFFYDSQLTINLIWRIISETNKTFSFLFVFMIYIFRIIYSIYLF